MSEHIIPIDDYERLTPRHERAFRLVTVSERKKLRKTTAGHVVWGLLRTGSVAALQGRPGLGKTALAVRLAKCLQDGLSFMERETKQATVIYIAAEDEDDVAGRLEAEGADAVLIAQVPEALSSRHPERVAQLIADIARDARKRAPGSSRSSVHRYLDERLWVARA